MYIPRVTVICVAVVIIISIPACGKKEKRTQTFAVTGRVVDGEKPVAHATVVFHPEKSDAGFPKPHGTTDANGYFKLTTYDGNDGAPAGNYKITIEQWLTTRQDEGPSNRLPKKFGSIESSGLTSEIAPVSGELPTLILNR